MLEVTDRHFRRFARLLTRRAWLYTEMVPARGLLRGRPGRWLDHDPDEHPVALQLGGSEPRALAEAAALGEAAGFAEINLNVGCPSARVQAGRFGACLMAEPGLVADCVAAMGARVAVPVTVKCRIGIDRRDRYEDLHAFVATVARAGCHTFIVHARKAWLKGLNPRQNRTVPPLRYEVVHRLKADFPHLEIILNGGLRDPRAARDQLDHVDGVMLGRAVAEAPFLLAQVDPIYYGVPAPVASRHAALAAFLPYARAQVARGVPARRVLRPLVGLFNGLPGARAWRRWSTQCPEVEALLNRAPAEPSVAKGRFRPASVA
jgi:tRNA-dihydrouridine synthase A